MTPAPTPNVEGFDPDPNRYPGHPEHHKCPACSKSRKLGRGEIVKPRPSHTPVTHQNAVIAANTRWEQFRTAHYPWDTAPLKEAELHLAFLRQETQTGSRALQQRYSTSSNAAVPCAVCKSQIPNGKWLQAKTIRNPDTALLQQVFLCSQVCIAKFTKNPANYPPPSDREATGLPKPKPSTGRSN